MRNNIIRIILLVFFILFNCEILAEQSYKKIVLPRLDNKKIEVKRRFYEKLANKSKRFRRAVYILGTGATSAFLIYLILKFTIKKTSDIKNLKNNDITTSESKKNEENISTSSYIDRFKFWRNYKMERQNESLWNLCKYNFKNGLTDWVYYAPITILSTTVFGVQSSIFSLIKNKFLKLWNGQDEDLFFNARRQINLILYQFKSFFEFETNFIEKEEIKDNCFVFVDIMENIFALISEKVERDFDNNKINNNMYYSVVCAQSLLFNNVEKFCEESEIELNKTKDKLLGDESLRFIFSSFKQINNQIIRFFNLCYSVCYENKK
ncbi:hypothetical protein KAT08_04745 [Candidatus Babeliales bacterium]|nr:hypothetical protein [Candidatus Babeliales bacterium]